MTSSPHRRRNALTGEWVLVSPHRSQRPWLGQQEPPAAGVQLPSYVSTCALCPGNERAGGSKNPAFEGCFVFDNDFPALLPQSDDVDNTDDELFAREAVIGTCRVIVYAPEHNVTMAQMSEDQIRRIVDKWCEQSEELNARYVWVQIFENKGEAMGCSNPHPHGQIWCGSSLPNEARKELEMQRAYWMRKNSCLLLDYVAQELNSRERVVYVGEEWAVFVPYWAVWPFETLLVPRRRKIAHLHALTAEESADLAHVMKKLFEAYDRLFSAPFPYSFGWHGAPNLADSESCWCLHAHVYPPLLRSATIRKFMVG